MASSVQQSILVSQFWPRGKSIESVAHCSTCDQTHWSCLLCMHGNVLSGLQLVWIIEGPDKRDPDNRDCTINVYIYTHLVMLAGSISCQHLMGFKFRGIIYD